MNTNNLNTIIVRLAQNTTALLSFFNEQDAAALRGAINGLLWSFVEGRAALNADQVFALACASDDLHRREIGGLPPVAGRDPFATLSDEQVAGLDLLITLFNRAHAGPALRHAEGLIGLEWGRRERLISRAALSQIAGQA